jgi:putative addiction module killer protein
MRVLVYLDTNGHSPFAGWFDDLDAQAAAKVTIALTRMAEGNLANTKSVGAGVAEFRIDWGPGYPHLLRPRRRDGRHSSGRRYQKGAAA